MTFLAVPTLAPNTASLADRSPQQAERPGTRPADRSRTPPLVKASLPSSATLERQNSEKKGASHKQERYFPRQMR